MDASLVPVPPEPGIRPEYLDGPPGSAAEALGTQAQGRAVWEVCYARFALREAVRLLRLAPDDEVLMPAFCCNTVSAPVAAAGARPVLYRVGPDARPDWDDVAAKAGSPNARALVAVHYLGFPADLAAATRIARERDLVLIEDCSHALFSADGAAPLGRTADLASYSLYKTLPVTHGAALAVHPARFVPPPPAPPEPASDDPRGEHLRTIEQRLIAYDRNARLGEGRPDLPQRDRMMQRTRTLYAADAAPHTIGRAARTVLGHVDRAAIVTRRRVNYRLLLARLGEWALFKSLPAGVCPLGFPILVAEREKARAGLEAAGIGYLLHWSRKLIPEGGLAVCPAVPFLADHVMTLPVHQDLSEMHVEYLAGRFRALGIPPATA